MARLGVECGSEEEVKQTCVRADIKEKHPQLHDGAFELSEFLLCAYFSLGLLLSF